MPVLLVCLRRLCGFGWFRSGTGWNNKVVPANHAKYGTNCAAGPKHAGVVRISYLSDASCGGARAHTAGDRSLNQFAGQQMPDHGLILARIGS